MKKIALLLLAFTFSSQVLKAQIDGPGDALFLGLSGDGSDVIVFGSLLSIPDNQVIYFNENEWNGSAIGSGGAFNTGEGALTWTNNTGSDLAAGTVVTLTNLASGTITASIGSISKSGTWNIAGSDDAVYAFIGSSNSVPTAFLSYIANGTVATSGSITNTGLVIGTNSIIFTGQPDVMVLSSFSCDGTTTDCGPYICDITNWSTEDGSNDQSNNGIFPDLPTNAPTFAQIAPLPINLIKFEVDALSTSVLLSFSTATERNNSHFEIERSSDGNTFTKIGEVRGAGNSNTIQSYTFEDRQPLKGINYYRLRQVDFDGQSSYSPVRSVLFGQGIDVKLTPQPVRDQLRVELTEALNKDAVWQIFDFAGRLVQSGLVEAENIDFQVDMTTLTDGNYVLRISGQSEIVKQFQKK
jgi:hypothetical protein